MIPNKIISVVYGECICWRLYKVGGSGLWDQGSTYEAVAEIQARNYDCNVLKSAKNPVMMTFGSEV